MAVVADLIDTNKDVDKRVNRDYTIESWELQCDGIVGDSTVVPLDAIHRIGITGIHGIPSADVTMVIKAGTQVLATYNFVANQSVDYRHGKVIWWTPINTNLVFNVTSASPQLFYITTVPFGNNVALPSFE